MTRQRTIKAICDFIRPAFHTLYDAVERNLEGSGISVPQRGLLQLLLETGAQTVPGMAHRLLVKRQFALRLANELEAKALIARLPNPTHKRSDLFELTQAGRTLMTGILASEARAASRVLSAVDDAALAHAAEVLAVLARASFAIQPIAPQTIAEQPIAEPSMEGDKP